MDLLQFFENNKKLALAFSGGVDSSYLLYAAVTMGAEVKPYYIRSAFQPEFEFEDAMRVADMLGIEAEIIELDVLSCPEIADNSPQRCYYCKRKIMSSIIKRAKEDGYSLLADGTNADDSYDDRPGMRAIRELGVVSPLRECGLTKKEIRRRSREAGLFTWNKPAYACLATRVASGENITAEKLERAEKSEEYLRGLGFSDFRVRLRGENALLQFTEDDISAAEEKLAAIKAELKKYFNEIDIDSRVREKSL